MPEPVTERKRPPRTRVLARACLITFALLALFLSTARLAHPAHATLAFSDNFDEGGLRSDWTWENPGVSSIYAVSGDQFNLVVTPGNDQWANVDRAPRILKRPGSASWTIETKLSTSTGNGATFGGLVVFKDPNDWLSLGWLQQSSLELSGIIEDSFTGPVGTSGWYDYLRLQKVGNTYYASGSRDGRNWVSIDSFTDTDGALTGARVGILGKDWGSIGAYNLSLSYFREFDDDAPPLINGIQSTRKLTQVTGWDSTNRTDRYDVCGADYGVMFSWLNRTYLAFGDTRSCRRREDMRPITLAYSYDTQPADGLRLDGWIIDSNGEAAALFPRDPNALTVIPTAAIGLGDSAYIFYADIVSWDMPPGAWSCSYSSIASAYAPDDTDWFTHPDTIAWGRGNFNELAVVPDPAPGSSTLYIYGTPCGRFGSVKLMAVDAGSILDKSAYRYFAGFDSQDQPLWSSSESAAVTVAGGPAGEMSAAFNPYLQQFVLTYLDQPKHGIVMRESPTPWGPWSTPVVIARDADYPQLYGAFMAPGFMNGRTFYYTMSQFGPYNTFWMQTTLP